MSGKTPHWPEADGEPGVSFGPKSLPEIEGGKPATTGAGEGGSSTPRLDVAAKNQPGQALAVPGRNTKQVNQAGGKPSQFEEPQQGGKEPAAGAKAALQTLPGPAGEKRPDAANSEQPSQPKQPNQPNQRTPRPMPQQVRAALSRTQLGKSTGAQKAAGAAAGAAAAGAAKAAGDTAKTTPWAATPTAGKPGKTTKDKFHKPEGTLSKVGEARRACKAGLYISHVDPWPVMKTTFLFSIALRVMSVVIVAVLWAIVAGPEVFQSIDSTTTQLLGGSGSQLNVEDYINAGWVIGLVVVLAALDAVIVITVSMLLVFLYNLAVAVIGGLEVTLTED